FISHRDGRLRLARQSPYARAGTDGHDPGADIDALGPAAGHLAALGVANETPRTLSVAIPVERFGQIPFRWSATALAERPRSGVFVFWMAFALLGYVYLGYPLVAALSAILQSRPRRRAPIEPTVSVIVPAHNEGERLAARIENLLALDYPL